MKIKVFLKKRSETVFAEAIYYGDKIVVLPGGKINMDFAEHIRGGRKAKNFRDNPDYVDKDGTIIKECTFNSPSTAAQFVTGCSTNGYEAWKVEAKRSLGDYLKDSGMR